MNPAQPTAPESGFSVTGNPLGPFYFETAQAPSALCPAQEPERMAAMKPAAILAVVVAIMLAGWALNDYRNNEQVRREAERQGFTSLALRLDSGENVELDMRAMAA